MRRAAAGAAAWLLLLVVAAVTAVDVPLVEAVLAFGPLVLVPLGLPLVRPASDAAARVHAVATRLQPAAALLAGAAVAAPRGTAEAVALAVPWLLLAAALALPAALAWLGSPTLLPVPLARTAAVVFLLVGAGWLVVDRAGVQPLQLDAAIVTLTAVHFHVAGFATSAIAARTAAVTGSPAPTLTVTAVAGIVVGPAAVAVGFAAVRPLQLAGAVVLTVGIYVLAWVIVRHVRDVPRPARVLLVVAAVAVVVPMGLAVQWAAGSVLGTPALGIPTMARTHGLVNLFGFAVPALVAWHLADGHAVTH